MVLPGKKHFVNLGLKVVMTKMERCVGYFRSFKRGISQRRNVLKFNVDLVFKSCYIIKCRFGEGVKATWIKAVGKSKK